MGLYCYIVCVLEDNKEFKVRSSQEEGAPPPPPQLFSVWIGFGLSSDLCHVGGLINLHWPEKVVLLEGMYLRWTHGIPAFFSEEETEVSSGCCRSALRLGTAVTAFSFPSTLILGGLCMRREKVIEQPKLQSAAG